MSLRTRRLLRSARSVAACAISHPLPLQHARAETHLSGPLLCPVVVVLRLFQGSEGCGLHAASRGIVTSARHPRSLFRRRADQRAFLSHQSHLAPRHCQSRTNPLGDDVRRAFALSRAAIMPSFPQFNPLRLRSYVFRLPLCTRLLLTVMVGLWIATIPFKGLRDFGSLEPDKVNLGTSEWFHYSGSPRTWRTVGKGENEGCIFQSKTI